MEPPKKPSYISGRNFPSSINEKKQHLKSFLYFGKWNFLASRLKTSYISGGNFIVPSLRKFLVFFLFFKSF